MVAQSTSKKDSGAEKMFESKKEQLVCKCCEVLRRENNYLRGLVDRLILKVAPPVDEQSEPKTAELKEDNKERISYGEV